MLLEDFQLPAVHLGVLNPWVGMQAHQTPQAPSAPAHSHQASQASPRGNELTSYGGVGRSRGVEEGGMGIRLH